MTGKKSGKKGRKGQVSSRTYVARNTLVRQGRASWWCPGYSVNEAWEMAGLV